jgi:penicillin-binding protein 2
MLYFVQLKSNNNAIKIKYDYPERGYIFDRWKLLVSNQASYDIMVIQRVKNIDTLGFCKLLKSQKRIT